MNIVAGTQKQTILNSFLNENNFSKIQFTLNLNETGLVAQAAANDFSCDMKFTFKEWKFNGTKVEEQSGCVLFTGKGFEGRPLLGIMQGNSTTEKARAVFAYSACVNQAVKRGIELPANGAGGILYGEADNKIQLLFLPQNIFDFSARNSSEHDYAVLQGVWQDKNFLSDNKEDYNNARALFFTRAVLIYAALTKEFPFAKENLEERQADILDSNYLPLENKVNGVSQILSDSVSFDLERSSMAAQKEQVKETTNESARNFCFEELAAELGLEKDGSVNGANRKPAVSEKEFQKAAKKLLAKKTKRVNASRVVRRNSVLFVIGVLLIIVGAVVRHNMRNTNLSRPTTVSLDARETAEVFFTGMHTLNTQLMQYSSKGSQTKMLVDSVGHVYVSSKMRSVYSNSGETYTPEFWVYKPQVEGAWQFGLTNFMLGENEQSLSAADLKKSAPTKKEKPVPLNEKNGAKKTLAAFLYRVRSEGIDSEITVEKLSGTIQLTFVKDRWLLTDLDMPCTEEVFPMAEFLADRNAALEQCAGDSIAAADILRQKYYWIPTQKDLHDARILDETTAAKRERGELY